MNTNNLSFGRHSFLNQAGVVGATPDPQATPPAPPVPPVTPPQGALTIGDMVVTGNRRRLSATLFLRNIRAYQRYDEATRTMLPRQERDPLYVIDLAESAEDNARVISCNAFGDEDIVNFVASLPEAFGNLPVVATVAEGAARAQGRTRPTLVSAQLAVTTVADAERLQILRSIAAKYASKASAPAPAHTEQPEVAQ